MKDYGSAWRILRISSLTDQIFIKAQRIRSIEEKGSQRVEEGVISEFIGIVNYSIIGLIQLELGVAEQSEDLKYDEAMNLFEKHAIQAKDLMLNKNHDYSEGFHCFDNGCCDILHLSSTKFNLKNYKNHKN